MAVELFKPFLYARLDKLGFATTIKQAKRLVEKERLRGILIDVKSKVTEERTVKRLKLIESFLESGNKPERMI